MLCINTFGPHAVLSLSLPSGATGKTAAFRQKHLRKEWLSLLQLLGPSETAKGKQTRAKVEKWEGMFAMSFSLLHRKQVFFPKPSTPYK